MSMGFNALRAITDAGAVNLFRTLKPVWFVQEELETYKFIKRHVKQYGLLPDNKTLRENGFQLPAVNQPAQYYVDRISNRAVYNAVSETQEDLTNAMRDKDIPAIKAALAGMIQATRIADNKQDYGTFAEQGVIVLDKYRAAKRSPGLQGITLGHAPLDAVTNGAQPGDVIVIAGRPNHGKAQPITEKVYMADGTFKRMGQILVGDKLMSVDGKPNRVMQIHRQGKIKIFKVNFSDGTFVECCANHLWRVYFRQWKGDKHRIVTTEKLISMLSRKRYKKRLSIETISGDFGKENPSIPAYTLGVLLGDGSITQANINFTAYEKEISNRVRGELLMGHSLSEIPSGNNVFSIISSSKKHKTNEYRNYLRRSGLFGKGSHGKFIPKKCFQYSRVNRLALAQGLFDTDGFAGKEGQVDYCSVSTRLANDVAELCRSLGYIAKVCKKIRKSGESYSVQVSGKNVCELFSLTRKKTRCQNRYKTQRLSIAGIEYVGKKEARCLTVSHKTSLYVTSTYKVTHNTYLLLNMMKSAHMSGFAPLVCSMEMSSNQLATRYIGMLAGLNPDYIRRGELSTMRGERALFSTIQRIANMPPLHFIEGNFRKSVADVDNMVQLFSPDILFVDAGYLLRPENPGKNYSKADYIGMVIEEIKCMAQDRNIPVIVSVQLNREAARAGKKGLDLSFLAGTDVIGQVSTVCIGLTKGKPPYEEMQRQCQIIKNREGALLNYSMNFTFSPMRFDYIPASEFDETSGAETAEVQAAVQAEVEQMRNTGWSV